MFNRWAGAVHVKHISKDNNDNKIETKLKPDDPCGGKVTIVSFLCGG